MLRPMIRSPDIWHKLRGNEDEEQTLEVEFKHFFEGDEQDDPIYKVQILNNLKVEAGLFYNSRDVCEYCNFEHSYNCDFSFGNESVTMKDILKRASRYRPSFALVVAWRASNPLANLDLIENQQVERHDMSSNTMRDQSSNSKQITLQDCF